MEKEGGMSVRNIAVLVSGGGTNLQALLDAEAAGAIRNGRIVRVISSKPGAFALDRAKRHGIETAVVERKACESPEEFDAAILRELEGCGADIVVLAGFLSILGPTVISRYENRILNVHPALIPSFCGKGYYGLRVHEEALRYGVKLTGATVHFVDNGMDTGPIILQKAVEVQQGDTPKSLQQRVMEEAEWKILPQAIDLIAQGRVTVVDGKTIIAS